MLDHQKETLEIKFGSITSDVYLKGTKKDRNLAEWPKMAANHRAQDIFLKTIGIGVLLQYVLLHHELSASS